MVPPGGGGAVGVTNPAPSRPVPGEATIGPPSAPMIGDDDEVGPVDPEDGAGDVDGALADPPTVDDEQADPATRRVARAATAGSRRETRGSTQHLFAGGTGRGRFYPTK